MTTTVKTQSEFYDIYKDEVVALSGDLTDFSEGSIHDIIAGALTICLNELSELTLSEFKKTYFDTAAESDLESLAVDHFGDKFVRPEATQGTGEVTFSRANTDAGNVLIPAGTVVKTEKDANGNEVSFKTDSDVTMTGLTIDSNVTADIAGTGGNVLSGTIIVIESALTDSSITVNNASAMAGGAEEEEDAEYRETIRSLIAALAGANKAAIEGALKAIPEIEFVSLIEQELPVIQYDIGGDQIEAGAEYFRIPYPIAYIADENGQSSDAIIEKAFEAIVPIKACGVKIDIQGATAQSVDWNISIVLNPAGPNFAELSSDTSKIEDSMQEYINTDLDIGDGFTRATAKNFIMDIWGPAGTGDLQNLTIISPSGDISGVTGTKLIAGTMAVS